LLIEIRDNDSLTLVSDLLHDAFFALEDAAHDKEQGVFRLVLWREVRELAQTRRALPLIVRVEAPWMRTQLEFSAVKEASVEETDGIGLGEYCLTEIDYNPTNGEIRFGVMGPLKLALHVDKLAGVMRDTGEPTWERPGIPTFRIG